MSEILGHGILTPVIARDDVERVVNACPDWRSEREIMIATGLGKGRATRAIVCAGDRLERMAQNRNTCTQRWIWRRRGTA
jgi:hypothetical protein